MNGRTERACYERRQRGETWGAVGAQFWETPPPEWGGTVRQWQALKASCAASRHALRAGRPWPIRQRVEREE